MRFIEKRFFSLISILVGLLVGLLVASPLVYATLPDITGTYSGTVIDTESSCFFDPLGANTPQSSDPPESVSMTLTITSFNTTTGAFSGTGTIGPFSDGESDSITFNGFVDGTGTVFSSSFTATESGTGDQIVGDFDMSVIANGQFVVDASGQDVIPNSFNTQCQIDATGTLTLISGGNVITPAITPSSTVTEAILFNTQIQSQVSDISKHITGALGGRRFFGGPRVSDNQFKIEGATGLSAGDGSTIPYGIWGSYSYSDYDNDLSSTAFDGNSHSFLGGLDFAFWENTVLGVAFGYDNGDIDTTFNLGHQDTDSYTIAPYFGALLTDTLSLDFNVGYSRVDYDQFRTLPGTTTRVSSSPDADRWFGALNLNGVAYYDNWILGARVGALWAKSVIDSYTESNGTVVAKSRNKVGEGSIAGDVAYSYKNFEPFLNVSYQYDFELTKISVTTGPQPSNDRDDILMTAGVRYYDNNGISGNLEYTKRFDRDDFDEDRISITVRVDF